MLPALAWTKLRTAQTKSESESWLNIHRPSKLCKKGFVENLEMTKKIQQAVRIDIVS